MDEGRGEMLALILRANRIFLITFPTRPGEKNSFLFVCLLKYMAKQSSRCPDKLEAMF